MVCLFSSHPGALSDSFALKSKKVLKYLNKSMGAYRLKSNDNINVKLLGCPHDLTQTSLLKGKKL